MGTDFCLPTFVVEGMLSAKKQKPRKRKNSEPKQPAKPAPREQNVLDGFAPTETNDGVKVATITPLPTPDDANGNSPTKGKGRSGASKMKLLIKRRGTDPGPANVLKSLSTSALPDFHNNPSLIDREPSSSRKKEGMKPNQPIEEKKKRKREKELEKEKNKDPTHNLDIRETKNKDKQHKEKEKEKEREEVEEQVHPSPEIILKVPEIVVARQSKGKEKLKEPDLSEDSDLSGKEKENGKEKSSGVADLRKDKRILRFDSGAFPRERQWEMQSSGFFDETATYIPAPLPSPSFFPRVTQIVKLNIGGYKYVTTALTLTSRGENFFTTLLSDKFPSVKDEEGAYFIDRDGEYFKPLLSFLRTGELRIPHGMSKMCVEREAHFYLINLNNDGIQPLARGPDHHHHGHTRLVHPTRSVGNLVINNVAPLRYSLLSFSFSLSLSKNIYILFFIFICLCK